VLAGISKISKSKDKDGLVLEDLCHFVSNTRHDDKSGEFEGRQLQRHEGEVEGKAV